MPNFHFYLGARPSLAPPPFLFLSLLFSSLFPPHITVILKKINNEVYEDIKQWTQELMAITKVMLLSATISLHILTNICTYVVR